ncbi:MAG: NAD-dependent epimerase/dehydratase family protein [Candidatus Fermentibacteria bacterium]
MYLVTGGAGFIGSNIAREALKKGIKVRILDNFSTGHWSNLADIRDSVDIIEGDIRSYHIVRKAMEAVEVVFHQGALPSVPRSIADPITTNEVNVQGTLNILHAALDAGCRRVLFASSSSIYGDAPEKIKTEGLHVRPLSPYAVSKLAGEKYMQVFHHIYGLETVALRYFNVFGPYQDPASPYSAVIPLFVNACQQGRRPVINGDGKQSRDFTYIANVVHANLLAADAPAAPGMMMNIACGDSITVNHLASAIGSLTGRTDVEPAYTPERPGDVKHSRADISLARKLLKYEPVTSFEEGLESTVSFMRERRV